MFTCHPINNLPLQGFDDHADNGNDTVLIPQEHFNVLFEDEVADFLGIKIVGAETIVYATCIPHMDGDNDVIYMPTWMLDKIGDDPVDVVRAEQLPEATGIVVRLIDANDELDVRALLEAQIYDFRYVHANTALTVGGGARVWIETVYAGEETVQVARLGTELALVVEQPLAGAASNVPSDIPPAPVIEEPATEPQKIMIPDAAELRRRRAAYYEAAFQRK